MNALSEEIRYRFPKLIANGTIGLLFLVMSYVVLWTLGNISAEIVFLLRIGFLLGAGIFLVRILFDALTILDKATGLFVKILGIREGISRQRIFKDTIFIVSILLISAAIFPLFNRFPNSTLILQQATTFIAFGLILLFVFDIGRIFYRISEKKVNLVANRIANSMDEEEERANEK